MSYLGFARKYRPQTFDEVVGQQHIATTLQNAIQSNRVHHAYIFCGSRGVGKTSMARIFSKALNCEQGPTITPCNKCLSCQRIATGEDIDVLEVDGASNRGIEEIRNIKENIKYLPSKSRFKVFIIDEVHMLTQAAFNALLKTLEEPPSHVKFVFATTHVASIPETILSRCQRFDFRKIVTGDIIGRLKQIMQQESITTTDAILQKIAEGAGGALRDSLVLLDQLASFSDKNIEEEHINKIIGNTRQEPQDILDALAQRDITKILEVIQSFFERGGDPTILLTTLTQKMRDILILKVTPQAEKFIEGAEVYLNWLKSHKDSFSPEFLIGAIHHIVESRNHLTQGLMGRIVVETLFLKISRMESMLPLVKMVDRLEALESRIAGGSVVSRPTSSANDHTPIESQSSKKEESNKPKNLRSLTEAATKKNHPVPPPPKKIQKTQPQDLWDEFLKELRNHFPNPAHLLKQEAKVEMSDTECKITIHAKFRSIVTILSTAKNKDIISDLLKKIYGKPLNLQFKLEGEKNPQLEQEVIEKDPLILRCLELFGGKILEVNKIESE